jgi:hypothetical protein
VYNVQVMTGRLR